MPRALKQVIAKMVQEWMENKVLEYATSPYSNQWFLVPKGSPGPKGEVQYQLINSCTKMNSMTLKDANIPPSTDEFTEDFGGVAMASVVDLFSGYDQIPLDVRSRDMTAFQSPIGLVRQMTLTQGWTGTVPVFSWMAELVTTEDQEEIWLPPEEDGTLKPWKPDVDNEL